MLQKLYTIFDRRAEEAGPIFMAKNDSVAMRSFENLLNEEGVKQDEYKLLDLGVFDNEKCIITTKKDPEEVIIKLSSEVL